MSGFVIVMPGASVRGDAYVRRGAKPSDANAWIIYPPSFRQSGSHRETTQLREKIDPSMVEVFESQARAKAWKSERVKHQRSRGRMGPHVAVVRPYEEAS